MRASFLSRTLYDLGGYAAAAGAAVAVACCVEHAALGTLAGWRLIGGLGAACSILGSLGCFLLMPPVRPVTWSPLASLAAEDEATS